MYGFFGDESSNGLYSFRNFSGKVLVVGDMVVLKSGYSSPPPCRLLFGREISDSFVVFFPLLIVLVAVGIVMSLVYGFSDGGGFSTGLLWVLVVLVVTLVLVGVLFGLVLSIPCVRT